MFLPVAEDAAVDPVVPYLSAATAMPEIAIAKTSTKQLVDLSIVSSPD